MKINYFKTLLFSISIILASCGEDQIPAEQSETKNKEESKKETKESEEEKIKTALIESVHKNPSRCGMEPYSWLEPDQTGKITDYKELSQFSATPAKIELALKLAGYKSPGELLYNSKTYIFRYTTQDRGKKVEATATLAIPIDPANENASISYPLINFLHFTTGVSDSCAPSRHEFLPYLGALYASMGYITVSPDYIGMNGFGEPSNRISPYIISEPTAIASIDAHVAAIKLLKELYPGINPAKDQNFLIGGSQGGHAAVFTSRFAPYYNPEIKYRAGAAMVPPLDVYGQAVTKKDKILPKLAFTIPNLIAFLEWYQPAEDLYDKIFMNGLGIKARDTLLKECGLGSLENEVKTIEDIFTAEILGSFEKGSLENFPNLECYYKENSLLSSSIKRIDETPFLIIYSDQDPLIELEKELKVFDEVCKEDAIYEFQLCSGDNHEEGALNSLSLQLDYLKLFIKDEYKEKACIKRKNTSCPSLKAEK